MKSTTSRARSLSLAVAVFVGAAASASAAASMGGVNSSPTGLLHNKHARAVKRQQQDDGLPLVEGGAAALLSTDSAAVSVSGGQDVEKVTAVDGYTCFATRACRENMTLDRVISWAVMV